MRRRLLAGRESNEDLLVDDEEAFEKEEEDEGESVASSKSPKSRAGVIPARARKDEKR
jgi:hypothetical protein